MRFDFNETSVLVVDGAHLDFAILSETELAERLIPLLRGDEPVFPWLISNWPVFKPSAKDPAERPPTPAPYVWFAYVGENRTDYEIFQDTEASFNAPGTLFLEDEGDTAFHPRFAPLTDRLREMGLRYAIAYRDRTNRKDLLPGFWLIVKNPDVREAPP